MRFQYNDGKTKANLGLQAGTYAIDNYADEKSLWKNIYEANIGVAIDKKEKLWLEAGILPSHIGLETAISSECLTLSRSLSSENSPFFLTGVQLNYQINKNWNVKGLLCNGWQRIEKVQGNSIPSIGGQVQYNKNKFTFNYSNFFGSEYPDSSRKFRFFNNLYIKNSIRKFTYFAGIDYGIEQTAKASKAYNFWLTPTLIGSYKLSEKKKIAGRIEYFQDDNDVIIATPTAVALMF